MSAIASASHVTPAVWRRQTCPVGKHDKVIALARGPEPSRGKKNGGANPRPFAEIESVSLHSHAQKCVIAQKKEPG